MIKSGDVHYQSPTKFINFSERDLINGDSSFCLLILSVGMLTGPEFPASRIFFSLISPLKILLHQVRLGIKISNKNMKPIPYRYFLSKVSVLNMIGNTQYFGTNKSAHMTKCKRQIQNVQFPTPHQLHVTLFHCLQ